MAEASADDTPLPYKKLAGFYLKRLLGEGGMGAVYEAIHHKSHGHVALKIMREGLADNPTSVERFEAEATNLAALRHPYIAEYVAHGVHRRGKRKPLYYLAMRFLQGCTLEQYVEKYGPRPVEEAIWIIAQACRGIHAAHEAEILHRDIKPANIFLVHAGDGRITGVRVIDFGIAKVRDEDDIDRLTRTGLWLGTLAYASPEQLASVKDLDYRSDIYSLGLVLYFLLTGKHAFDGKSAAVVYGMQTKGIPEIPGLDTSLMDIIRKATTFDREGRYQDVAGLIIALELCRPDLFVAPPVSGGAESTPAVAPTAVMPQMMPAPAVLYGLPPAPKASDDPDATDEHHDSVPRVVKWFTTIFLLAIFLGALVAGWLWWESAHPTTPAGSYSIPTTVVDATAPQPADASVTADAATPVRPRRGSQSSRPRVTLPNGISVTFPRLRQWQRAISPEQRVYLCRLLREQQQRVPEEYCPTPPAPAPGSFGGFGGMRETGPRPTWVDN